MNTLSYQVLHPFSAVNAEPPMDWLDMPWGGPYEEEDLPIALCGSWECPGHCDACLRAELALQGLVMLPLYGPVNQDGIPLGFLIVQE